jgi:hypothetical protein
MGAMKPGKRSRKKRRNERGEKQPKKMGWARGEI